MVGTVTQQEVRADFAQRLVRRFEAMAEGAPGKYGGADGLLIGERWRSAARVVDLVLNECNEEDGDAGNVDG